MVHICLVCKRERPVVEPVIPDRPDQLCMEYEVGVTHGVCPDLICQTSWDDFYTDGNTDTLETIYRRLMGDLDTTPAKTG